MEKRPDYKFDEIKKARYLGALRQGMRRGAAAKAAGVHRATVCHHQRHDPEFAAACDQAEVDACDPIEDALWDKARSGNTTAIIFWLLNRSAGRWVDKRNQAQPQAVQEDTLLKEILARLEKQPGGE